MILDEGGRGGRGRVNNWPRTSQRAVVHSFIKEQKNGYGLILSDSMGRWTECLQCLRDVFSSFAFFGGFMTVGLGF